jgi:soluble lytic murein transglycosylase-like protein
MALVGARSIRGLLAATSLIVLLPAAFAQAQDGPCVYTHADGRVVITDRHDDPACPRPAASPEVDYRAPGRLNVTVSTAEMIALAHDAAVRYRVDHRLVESLIEMESAFKPDAVSHAGAMGLMQLMPAVARRYGVHDALDPAQNVDAGVRHLRVLLLRYGGDLEQTLAAYNAGPGAVDRYNGVPPYLETREYIYRVIFRYRQRVAGRALH